MSCLSCACLVFNKNKCLSWAAIVTSFLLWKQGKVSYGENTNNSNDDDPSPFTGSVVSVGAVWASGLVGAHCCPLWPVSPLTHSWHPPAQPAPGSTHQPSWARRSSFTTSTQQSQHTSQLQSHATDIKGGIFHHSWGRWQHWDTDNGHLQCNVHYVEA